MKKAKMILNRLLYPQKILLCIVPAISFAALIFIFATEMTESAAAYVIYPMSAYSLVILIAAMPKICARIGTGVKSCAVVRRLSSTSTGDKILHDRTFREYAGLGAGMTVNFLHVLFRAVAGIRYASVWFISIAVYYLVLGYMRASLFFAYRKREMRGEDYEYRVCRRTARQLFLLNIPMGGMILLMIRTDSGFSYPGYVIYISALYTFYAMISSAVNLLRFRMTRSPIMTASKVVKFVAALMSILGLQTAMISRFSENGEAFRVMMNTITGGFVYAAVIGAAIYLQASQKHIRKEVPEFEQIGK